MATLTTKTLTAAQLREVLFIAAKAYENEAADLRRDTIPHLYDAKARAKGLELEALKRKLAMTVRNAANAVTE